MKKGFTLIELILTISLIGILLVCSGLLLTQGLDSYSKVFFRSSSLEESRYAMERMVRELRKIGDEGNALQNIDSDQITFLDENDTDATFSHSGQSLYRNGNLLLDNVSALTFTGFRENGSTTTAAVQVRRVQIRLSTLPPGQNSPIILQTGVFLRNFIYENFQ